MEAKSKQSAETTEDRKAFMVLRGMEEIVWKNKMLTVYNGMLNGLLEPAL